jgi:hypothetical protein
MPLPKPADCLLLLEVFHRGLILGLISKSDVTSWSDEIILNTNEPDYFFIEVSLCSNENNLIEVLGQHITNIDNPICTRALFGLLYKQLTDQGDALRAEAAAKLIGELQDFDTLTNFEYNQMWQLYEYDLYYLPDFVDLRRDLSEFLSLYAPFTLTNYNSWAKINDRLKIILKQKEFEDDRRVAAIREEWQLKSEKSRKAIRKQRLKRKLNISVLIIIVAGILVWAYLTPSTSPFDWRSITSTIVVCGLFIGKEYLLKARRR